LPRANGYGRPLRVTDPRYRTGLRPFFHYVSGVKLEPTCPAVPDTGTSASARLTLDRGSFAGQPFAVTFSICHNPACPCGSVGFECWPLAEPGSTETGLPGPPASLHFDLEVFQREVNTQVPPSPQGLALAQAVVAEMQSPDWEWLVRLFRATKRRQMETMDLDTVHVVFPPEVLAGEGSMVAYAEVFPWAEAFEFSLGGACWVADDQYCVRPGCNCTETALAFFHLPKDAATARDPLAYDKFLRHDYVRGKTEVVEAKPGSPAAPELMQALRTAHPDFERTFRERHRQLKQLGKRHLPKTRRRSRRAFSYLFDDDLTADEPPPSPAPAARSLPKVGRNDPCPCGSGRRYKRCCGR